MLRCTFVFFSWSISLSHVFLYLRWRQKALEALVSSIYKVSQAYASQLASLKIFMGEKLKGERKHQFHLYRRLQFNTRYIYLYITTRAPSPFYPPSFSQQRWEMDSVVMKKKYLTSCTRRIWVCIWLTSIYLYLARTFSPLDLSILARLEYSWIFLSCSLIIWSILFEDTISGPER